MTKRLQQVGNSFGIIFEKPILSLLKITPETDIDVSLEGDRIVLTPRRGPMSPEARSQRLREVQARVMADHGPTFKKLAK